jgi:choline dehydrogenase-like flavoprotein
VIRDLGSVDGDRLDADVCIVGSGAAGITIARDLDGSPLRVLVLEGGGRSVLQKVQELYRADVAGLSNSGVHDLRFRVFGGSTTRWAGQALPLLDADFERREWVPHSGWPLSRDELEPYYRRAAEVLEVRPFPRDPAAEWPAALAPAPAFEPGSLVPYYSQFGPRPDFSLRFGAALERSPNIEVLLDANVVALVPDAAVSHIAGARVRSLAGREIAVSARQFVLCTGGIEVPRILLASEEGCDGGLGNSHDLVGRCFQEHPSVDVGPVTGDRRTISRWFGPAREAGIRLQRYAVMAPSRQRSERLLQVNAEVVFPQADSINAGKLLFNAVRRPELRDQLLPAARTVARDPLPLLRSGWRYLVQRRPALDTSGTPYLAVGGEQAPNPESRVRLGDDRDALGMRRAVLDWRLTEQEIRTWRQMAELTAGEFERLGLGFVDVDRFALPDDPGELSGRVVDRGHHMGTARMAEDPREGVVDRDCRVHGLENLWIASSAVFPTGGFSNPTFTIIALCLRLADRLKSVAA